MKIIGVASLLAVVVAAFAAIAQPMGGRGGGGPCGGHSFDPAKIERVSGRIAEIGRAGMGHHARGTHAWIETSSGKVEIMLGPTDFVKAQTVSLAAGDEVEVSGWRMQMGQMGQMGNMGQMGHGEMFVASEIRRGNDVLKLRDGSGAPAWKATEAGLGDRDDAHPCADGAHQGHEHAAHAK